MKKTLHEKMHEEECKAAGAVAYSQKLRLANTLNEVEARKQGKYFLAACYRFLVTLDTVALQLSLATYKMVIDRNDRVREQMEYRALRKALGLNE